MGKKHLFFIDPLEKLNIAKDSTLLMALSFQKRGDECYLLFEEDFALTTSKEQHLTCYSFSGEFKEDGVYLKELKLERQINISLDAQVLLHMRIDPPFDARYLRYLWMLDFLQKKCSIEVTNNPLAIMHHNEKISAFLLESSMPSYVGSSWSKASEFIAGLASDITHLVFKPLDLYSGIGVEKFERTDNLESLFKARVEKYAGAIIVQPFAKEVLQGEYRALYFKGDLLGAIIKRPPQGDFISNIAHGASFETAKLPQVAQKRCAQVARDFFAEGVDFAAFDILGDTITEINVTCPGLLVEVSHALGENLALKMSY